MTEPTLEDLLPLCRTDQQEKTIRAYFECGSYAGAAREIGRNAANVRRSVEIVLDRFAQTDRRPHLTQVPRGSTRARPRSMTAKAMSRRNG